jgi:dephospho-CoA kinase
MSPRKVGITGGIGSGKSTIARIFSVLGVPVYDADSRAKRVMTTDGILIEQIKKEFGTLAYRVSGELDRAFIASVVFKEPEKLTRLNALVHPRVKLDFEQWVAEQPGAPYVLKEAALLYEAGSAAQLEAIIVVTAPVDVRVQRVVKRDAHRSPEAVRDIMKNQMPDEEKVKRADYVIVNDESRLVIPQVLEIHQQLMRVTT